MPLRLNLRPQRPSATSSTAIRHWHRHPDHHGRHPHEAPCKPSLCRTDSSHSRYVRMLLDQDDIPALHNILASVLVWLLLAGFLVFPGTFTSIRHSLEHQSDKTAAATAPDDADWNAQTTHKILRSINNVPLLVLGAVACGISVVGIATLAIRHVGNYVWLSNKIFVPAMANCMAGLISTLVGVYAHQHGSWSITAKVTAIVEGSGLGISIALFLLFDTFLLSKVRQKHNGHYQQWPSDRNIENTYAHKW
ncbi:hypothetical protein CDD81_4955 [Ophiocordyceps australis]|uniref:Uncharacterized protein n=1 Tax=Ophiocordyceps australis TaxID=1399860 RepID=A0A2C5XVK1_9HYPO|nr:hypothetical protein CDD81_4955 [Ophiocordyceps australis]